MYIYECVCDCTSLHILMYIRLYLYTYSYSNLCVIVHVYIFECIYDCTCIHVYVRMYMRLYMHTYINVYIIVHVYICTYESIFDCTADPTLGDIFECCFKTQSSKLERLFCHVSVKRDVRALSFEF